MKLTGWAKLKIALIGLFTIPVVTIHPASNDDVWTIGEIITGGAAIGALFQLGWWFACDVFTLKCGGWVVQPFGHSPIARETFPGFHLDIAAIVLLAFGNAKVLSASLQGPPALILGTCLLLDGILLRAWEKMLRHLFHSHFIHWTKRPCP